MLLLCLLFVLYRLEHVLDFGAGTVNYTCTFDGCTGNGIFGVGAAAAHIHAE